MHGSTKLVGKNQRDIDDVVQDFESNGASYIYMYVYICVCEIMNVKY